MVDCADSMDNAFELLSKNDYSLLAICADNVEYLNELETIQQFRGMPILLFSHSRHGDPVTALQSGAHIYLIDLDCIDYLVESSVAMSSYYLKLKHACHIVEPMLLTYGCVHMSTDTHQVFIKGTSIVLTRKEFNLLHYFLLNKGIVLTYEQIYNNIWGWSADGGFDDYSIMHNLVRRLRKKLDCAPEVRGYITSVWEVGYRFGTL
jgi:DNA-binding response OmpR family regulator